MPSNVREVRVFVVHVVAMRKSSSFLENRDLGGTGQRRKLFKMPRSRKAPDSARRERAQRVKSASNVSRGRNTSRRNQNTRERGRCGCSRASPESSVRRVPNRNLARIKSALSRRNAIAVFRERGNEPDTSARVSSETRSEAVCAPSESQSSLP